MTTYNMMKHKKFLALNIENLPLKEVKERAELKNARLDVDENELVISETTVIYK